MESPCLYVTHQRSDLAGFAWMGILESERLLKAVAPGLLPFPGFVHDSSPVVMARPGAMSYREDVCNPSLVRLGGPCLFSDVTTARLPPLWWS